MDRKKTDIPRECEYNFDAEDLCRIMAWILVIIALLWTCSCSTIHDVEVIEKVRTDSVFIEKVRTDSIYVHDSISVSQKGDTTILYKERMMYKYVYLRDTINVGKQDTAVQVKIQEKIVEKKVVGFWGKFLGIAGGIAIVACVALMFIKKLI